MQPMKYNKIQAIQYNFDKYQMPTYSVPENGTPVPKQAGF
jgi:hypothetical protein